MLLKSLMQKGRKYIHEIPSYTEFSYIRAPKPVERIDPSRLERVQADCLSFPIAENVFRSFFL